MGVFLVILAFVCLLIGLLGAVLPVIPGPPLSYLGLLLINWSGYGDFSSRFLWIWAAVAVAVTLLDYYLPAWMTKRFGGSRGAVIGSMIGLVAGLFVAPIGIIVGPFAGAFVGELLNEKSSGRKALKVALGSFAAFICGTGLKLVTSGMMIFYAVKTLIS